MALCCMSHSPLLNLPGPDAELLTDIESVLAGLVEAGIPPADVADAVADAVLDDRFYVLTHPDSTRAVEARTAAILEGAAPPMMLPRDGGAS